jgi:hypothetical protein
MAGAVRWGQLVVAVAVACVCAVLAPAAQASLSVPSTTFTGSSTGGTSVPAAIANFKAAAGGVDNGAAPGEQGSGFRQLTWDGIAVDGSDASSTVIVRGKVVAVARGRAQPWGLELGPNVAVANDGFASVNSHAGFAPFSPPNEWAPFNSNSAEFQIVVPSAQTSSPAPAVTRGIGVVFLNVKTSGTTIQYYSGNSLLTQASAPLGDTSFVGVLFRDPVVTRVVITLGTATMFNFDGSPGGQNPTTLVAGDDVVLAEPGSGEPTVATVAGVPVSPVLDSFTDTNSGATASDFTATIDWGDATRSSGTIAPAPAGGFVVTGSHAYAQTGIYSATVTVADLSGSELTTQALIDVAPRVSTTSVACSPSPVAVTASTICTATVSDADAGGPIMPTGRVAFSSPTAGASFADDSGCVLGATETPGVAICEVEFTPTQLPPAQARIDAFYAGDGAHAGSSDNMIIGVRVQRCTLKALSVRLKRRPAVLGVLVTCDARANVAITVKAVAARKARSKAFSLQFGGLQTAVTAGRPTVLVIKPFASVLGVLRAAERRHQRLSLKLTLTASSHATRTTTTTRVSAIRIP